MYLSSSQLFVKNDLIIITTKDNNETDKVLAVSQIPYLRQKWSDLSEYVKDIKQRFSQYYNKKHNKSYDRFSLSI